MPPPPPTGTASASQSASSRTQSRNTQSSGTQSGSTQSGSTPKPTASGQQGERPKKRKTPSDRPTTPEPETASKHARKTGSYTQPYVVSDSEEDNDGPTASSSFPQTPRKPSMQSSFTAQQSPTASVGLSSPSRRRREPLGVYVGRWNASGLGLHAANAVYASTDSRGRVNRRISKEDNAGSVVLGGAYDPKRTACSHDAIAYIDKYRGMSKGVIDNMIKGVLVMQSAPLALPAATPAPLMLSWYTADNDDDAEDDAV